MNKYILSIVLAAVAGTLATPAITIANTAGSLASRISDPASVADLAITGSVNASDLFFVASSMPALRTLDLSRAAIDACSMPSTGGKTSFAASTVPAHVFAGSALTSVALPAAAPLFIGDAAFAGSALTSVNIGSNVASVGHGSFSSCPALATVTLASPAVGDGAFAGCTALATVTVAAPATLGDNAFADCTALRSVDGSDKITSIGDRAFEGCSELDGFAFGKNLTFIGDEAFMRSGLTSVNLSGAASLAETGKWAFAMMPRLDSFEMGDVPVAGEGIVFDCPALKNFNLSLSATEVPDYAYTKNSSVEATGLLNSQVTHIGKYALAGLSHVTSITLPAGLEMIDDHAMAGMTGLSDINLDSENVPATGADVWHGINQSTVNLTIPENAEESFKAADQWKNFNILTISGVEDVTMDEQLDGLKARFDGDILRVSIAGAYDISALGLYNAAGALIFAGTPRAQLVEIDTSGSAERVYILVATLGDGRRAALKIAK